RKKSLAQRTPLAGHTVWCWREVKDRKTHQHQKRCVYRRNKSPTAGNYSGKISGYRHGGQHTRNKHDQQFCSSRDDISRTEDPECSSLLVLRKPRGIPCNSRGKAVACNSKKNRANQHLSVGCCLPEQVCRNRGAQQQKTH